MTEAQLRAVALGMAGDRTTARVKTSPEERAALIANDPATFAAAPHVGRHGWVEVRLAGVDRDEMRGLVIEAWRRTAPGRAVDEYDEG